MFCTPETTKTRKGSVEGFSQRTRFVKGHCSRCVRRVVEARRREVGNRGWGLRLGAPESDRREQTRYVLETREPRLTGEADVGHRGRGIKIVS